MKITHRDPLLEPKKNPVIIIPEIFFVQKFFFFVDQKDQQQQPWADKGPGK
jgi:hypothetical protein